MGASCSDNRTSIQKQVDDFLRMLKVSPKVLGYSKNKKNTLTFSKAWSNPVFGGSVLSPLGQLKKLRSRPN